MMSRKTLVIVWLGFLLGSTAFGAVPLPHNVTLAWNASPSVTVAGYRLYQGGAPQTYTNVIDVGDLTTVTVPNLTVGVTYFFAVTAYDLMGLESAFSDEIRYTVPGTAWLRISASPDGGVLLTGTAPSGYQYDVLRTTDLKTWVGLGSVTADAAGSFRFADAFNLSPQPQYYRVRQTSP